MKGREIKKAGFRRAAFKPLARLAVDRWQDTAAWLDKDYQMQGDDVLILNRSRGDRTRGSCSFHRKTGQWADFATGDSGADLIDMGKMVHGFPTMTEAAESLAQHLGVSESDLDGADTGNSTQKKKIHITGPVPQEAIAAIPRFESYARQVLHLTQVYQVKNPAGELLLLRCKLEPIGEEKTVKPYAWDTDKRKWMAGGDFTRFFYGLERLTAQPGATVLIVEGEKTADAAALIFPDLAVLGLMGSKACRKVELEPLKNRDVVLWPDADTPGIEAMRTLEARLMQSGNPVRLVVLPEPVLKWTKPGKTEPGGWDLADTVPDGVDVHAVLDAAVVSQPSKKSAPAGPLFPGQTVEVETPPTAVIDAELAQMGREELGLTQRFIARWGATTRWCPGIGWYVWDGRRWKEDETTAKGRAQETLALLIEEARTITDTDQRAVFMKWAGNTLGNAAKKRNAVLSLAEPHLVIESDKMDVDPWLLNVANGVLDLRTGQLSPHDPALLLTKLAPVEYIPDAQCPTWDRFMRTTMDGSDGMVKFLQRAMGMTLTGKTGQQEFFFLTGTGANGKGKMMFALREILGDYAGVMPRRLVTGEETHDTDALQLRGVRYAEASEPPGKTWNVPALKRITGNDPLEGRNMRASEHITFKPVCKVWVQANTSVQPRIQNPGDEAFWRRFRYIPFPVKFYLPDEDGYAEAPENQRAIQNIDDLFVPEFPGILRWMVEGCLEWQRDGRLGNPPEMQQAKDQYRAEQNPVRTFIEEMCIVHPEAWVSCKLLAIAFKNWAEAAGETVMSPTGLTRTIQGNLPWFKKIHGVVPANTNETRQYGQRGWSGIGLKEPPDLKGHHPPLMTDDSL